MRKIKKPTDKVERILSECSSNIADPAKKERLQGISSNLTILENEYNEKGDLQKLHEISVHKIVADVTKEELKALYTEKLVPKTQRGRIYYDRIRNSAPLDICPLCSQRNVSTLDHVLPKGSYPGLSITPFNIVPSCKDCNTDKNELVPQSASQVHLHPYYDNVETERWLFSEVLETNPITFKFKVERVEKWDDILNDRILHHFKVFNLEKLYSIHAAAEIQDLKYLKNMRETIGKDELQKHLVSIARGKLEHHKNNWKTAMFCFLAESEWFCDEGVLTI